ncbi:serine/threonine-protein kinase pim-2-like [Epinephelus fuscoguttatus]|uniref:serine/threonine-protein kinase pim-2-like n=1 Tax=Epinephelus fuscoguttatus TaxID=293821 RepID=UPI0020D0EE4B|nr:serine/threonine-protein kinase pim-2-like [Epinephelus fuscoguttatus]
MSSKSFHTTNSGQCQRSSKQPGCNIDLINHAVKDCRSEGSKTTSKKKSEESLERASKRSRTSQSPSNSGNQTFSGPSSSSLVTGCKRTSIKRKSTDDKSEERPRTPSPSEEPKHQTTSEASSSSKPGTSSSVNTGPPCSRAAFEARYEEEERLGRGGFGTVFAGRRKYDNLPVAIKHIPQPGIQCTSMLLGGKTHKVPLEVALLLKLKPVAAVVTLLDWYNLDHELILVLERPVPCSDLINYMNSRESALQEHEAKAITKQLVNALIEVHSRGVFHRDIKPENILIETGSDVPRVRLIDFGCGTFLSGRRYTLETGTYPYTPPEWFQRQWYMAEPTTVWQLGVVLFEMLHDYMPFNNSSEIMTEEPNIREDLSINCNSFLQRCLTKRPEARSTLRKLKIHPWLM